MKKPSILNNILFIFPVMGYFALEALVVGVVITMLLKIFLSNQIGNLGYPQIVVIYWIAKMLWFDVFKLITGISHSPQIEEQDENQLTEKDFR